MSTPDDSPGKGVDEVTSVINEAREEIKKEVNEAKTDDERRELAERLREELERIKLSAEEVVSEEKEINEGRKLAKTKTEEAKKNLRTLTRVIEAAKRGIQVGKTAESQILLVKLAERDLTPSIASALEFCLSDYLIGNKRILIEDSPSSKSDFESDFENLVKVNLIAAKEVVRALEKAVEEGRLTSITKEKIEKLKSHLIEKSGERERMPTKEEMEDFVKVWRVVNERIGEKVRTGAISPEKQLEYNRALFSKDPVSVSILRDLGLGDSEIEKFLRLRPSYYGELNTRFMEGYLPRLAPTLHQAQNEFNAFFQQLIKRNEKGEVIMDKKDRQRLKNMIRKYLYYGLREIHQHKSEDFHHALQERSDVGHYFSLVHQVIGYNCERIAELLPRETASELKDFLVDAGGSFINRTLTFAQIFHNLPLYVRNINDIENLSKMFAYMYPSQLAEIFDDETNFMMVARDELTMLIREYLVKRDNIYGSDFLSGQYKEEGCYWSEGFRRDFIGKLREKLERLGIGLSEEDEWKLSMFSTYAEGIGIATLTDAEILITSRPVGHFRDVHPLMQLLSAKHNWLGGRGEKGVGDIINKYLLGMDVELLAHERPFLARLIKKRRFVPEEIKRITDKRYDDYGGRVIQGMVDAGARDFLFDMGGLYQELISMFSVPGTLDSWHGWRVEGVTNQLKSIFPLLYSDKSLDNAWKGWSDQDWRDFFDLSLELYGTTSLWWQIGVGGGGNRVTHEIRRFFLDICGGDINKAEEMYGRLSGAQALDRVIDFPIDDPKYKGRKISFLELRNLKMNQLRAEIFFRFLRRNPGEFLSIFLQLVPEILNDETLVFKSEKEIRELGEKKRKTKTEIDRDVALREALRFRWGDDLYNLFGKVHQWLGESMVNFKNPKTGEAFTSRKEFFSYFLERSSDAFERLKIANEPLRRQIIKIANDPKLSKEEKREKINEIRKKMLYLRKEDFKDDVGLWEVFAGDKGFFTLLTGVSYDKADDYFENLGGYNRASSKNLFFKMAEVWYLRNDDINPFPSDMAYYDIFKHISLSGENALKRVIDADLSTYKEVVSQIPQLESILLEAAQTGDFKKIYELHQKIHKTLSGLAGLEHSYRANYILSQIVTQFFMEHSVLRDPIYNYLAPVNAIMRALIGKNRSLSRLLTGNIHAYSMDANAVRDYFIKLANMGVINGEGIYSQQQLEKVFEVTKGEFILGDVGPKLAWFIILFLLWTYIKKAMEEAEGKKK